MVKRLQYFVALAPVSCIEDLPKDVCDMFAELPQLETEEQQLRDVVCISNIPDGVHNKICVTS